MWWLSTNLITGIMYGSLNKLDNFDSLVWLTGTRKVIFLIFIADYSCALQKEILVHGRLYVTQNYLCFYANIFGWETNLTLRWKEVSAITKEKTALVIPNAVLISTRSEKYFFTSFVARDKTFLMLFRVWQNALLDQPMTPQEMWQWVCKWFNGLGVYCCSMLWEVIILHLGGMLFFFVVISFPSSFYFFS